MVSPTSSTAHYSPTRDASARSLPGDRAGTESFVQPADLTTAERLANRSTPLTLAAGSPEGDIAAGNGTSFPAGTVTVADAGDGTAPDSGAIGAAGLRTIMPPIANVVDGAHGTGAETALAILEDLAAGRAPFRPELGSNGPVQWFVTEGRPRTGRGDPDIVIPSDVVVPRGARVLEFDDAALKAIYDRVMPDARQLAGDQYFARFPDRSPTSRTSIRNIEFNARNIAERRMWTEVGERVAASRDGLGRVVQSADSAFSPGAPGTFMLTSKPQLAQVRGGPGALLDVIRSNGVPAEPAVVEAAEAAARTGAIAGQVQDVVRVGGRVLVVAGLALDGIRIYRADDRIREAVAVGGGWAGAAGAVMAYNSATGLSNLTGPWAWAGNVVGSGIAGYGGYVAGEKITEYVYDLVIDPEPLSVDLR